MESLRPSPRNCGALLLAEEYPPPQGPTLLPRAFQQIDLNIDAGGRGWGAVLAVPAAGTVAESTLLEAVSSRFLPNMTIQAVASALRTGLKLCRTFTDAEQKEGSNVRELLATKYLFQALCPALAHLPKFA